MKQTLMWLVIGLLVIVNGVLGTLFLLERSAQDGSINKEATQSVVEDQAESSEFDISAASEPTEVEQLATEFTASFGKFSLKIPAEYRVVIEQDGKFESTSATKIMIGRGNFENSAIVNLPINDFVEIQAFRSSEQGSADEFVTADTAIQAALGKEEVSEVAGVRARKFLVDGVGETTKYFFENDGVTYLIESWDVSNAQTEAMLNDVVEGFSFN